MPNGYRAMDVYEIALNYTDAQHQGDRRKKSQQCILDPFTISSILIFLPIKLIQNHIETILSEPVISLES